MIAQRVRVYKSFCKKMRSPSRVLLVCLGHVGFPAGAIGAAHAARAAAAPRARALLSTAGGAQRPGTAGALDSGAAVASPTADLPERLGRMARALGEAADARARALALVQLGAASSRCVDGATNPVPPGASKVRGCTSLTYVAATVDAAGRASLRGSSDAALSRGLLALIVDGLDGLAAADVLRVRAERVRELASLDGALSASRINGLDNILAAVQAQLGGGSAAVGVVAAPAAAPLPELLVPPAAPFAPTAPARSLAASTTELPEALLRNQYWAMPAQPEAVALLISGGVDSSVALHLLQQQGIPVRAYYLRVWLADELADLSDCPWEEDWAYCSAVCEQLKVPLEAVSVQAEYWERVVRYLVDEARAGRTPNPDVMCNSRIKFGVFLDLIGKDFAQVASGHYARLRSVDGHDGVAETQLLRAADRHKDQSYFLSSLTQAQLARLAFPIGDMPKPDVRALAAAQRLPTSARKDSQGVCFLGRLQFDQFLKHHLGERPGPVVEFESGERIGTHRGIWYHTVGQRRGIVPGLRPKFAAHGPWHVVAKDVPSDTVFVSRAYAAIEAQRSAMDVSAISWTSGRPPCAPGGSARVGVQVRHGDGSHEATIALGADGRSGRVQLDRPDKGLAPGQFAAFYDGDVCLGAGVIG
jgi:tRNA-specific 2-thiouridylase